MCLPISLLLLAPSLLPLFSLLLLLPLSLVLAASSTPTPTSEPFSDLARQHVLALLQSTRLSDAKGWENVKETYGAVKSYQWVEAPAVPEGNKLCQVLQSTFSSAVSEKDYASAHYAAAAAEVVKCSGFNAPSSTRNVLQSGLQSKNLGDVYHASQAVLALVDLKAFQLKDFDYSSVQQTLLNLLEEDGTFRSSPDDDEGSAYHAGLALEVLGELASKLPSAVSKDTIRQVVDKVQPLVKTGFSNPEKQLDFMNGAPSDVTPLQVVSALLSGFQALSVVAAEPLDLKKPQVIALGDFVLRHSFVATPSDARALGAALQFLADNPSFIPYYVSVKEATANGKFRLVVTNILGRPTTKLNVLVDTAKRAGGKGPGLKDLVFQAADASDDNTEYVLNDQSAAQLKSIVPGFYEFKLNLVPSTKGGAKNDRYKPQADVLVRSKVMWGVTFGQRIDFNLSSSPTKASTKDGDIVKTNLRYPDAITELEGETFDGTKHLSMRLRFLPEESRPTSAFLHFVHASTDHQAMFVLKPVPDQDDVYTLKLSLGSSELIESLNGSGVYTISLVFGDATIERLITWKLGNLNLNIPASSRMNVDSYFAPKPTFLHSFRAPDSRPSNIVALIFTLFVFAPLGGLIVAISGSGLKFQLPTNPSEFLYAIIFQGSIAAILFLYTFYWLSLNIFQALALLAICGIVAVFSGNGALRLLHQRSTADSGKKGE